MAKRGSCPICGKPPVAEFTPFCSRGCKDRDLLQWLGDGYRLPGEPVDPDIESGVDRRLHDD
ncbi:DNA gyrase inhibitor YacG [Sphingomonas canadensis]|uniref:DNA gyrase inhibitor YacG n=1 Tax=Sphingomonas canadensis TaxID=1219257 RepID=A0ABW3HBB5_9SPHN|nr:DNA gyrase inhibitor YacG [Sphingomonas canadensis]MCW3838345.1 DNA gyrase inhibitor YacG [Sphingomonas canadensis]